MKIINIALATIITLLLFSCSNSNEKSITCSQFIEDYKKGADISDKNINYDGKPIKLEGVPANIMGYEDSNGKKSTLVGFGKNVMSDNYEIHAFFPKEMEDSLKVKLKNKELIKFKGKVKTHKMWSVEIEECEIVQ